VTTHRPTQGQPPGDDEWAENVTDAAEIKGVMALAGSDADVLADLDGCVTRLHAVQQAKPARSRLDAKSMRHALAARRRALGGNR
jgi:hypothetical protein